MENILSIFDDFPLLESKRCAMRNVKDTDCEDIYDIYFDKEVMKYQCGT